MSDLAAVREGRCPSCAEPLEIEEDETCPSLGRFGRCPKCRSCWQAEGEKVWQVYPKGEAVSATLATLDGMTFDLTYFKLGRPVLSTRQGTP